MICIIIIINEVFIYSNKDLISNMLRDINNQHSMICENKRTIAVIHEIECRKHLF